MKAVMSSVSPDVIALRKRTGADRWDEMWEGVLHMPPSPTPEHQDLEGALESYLRYRWAQQGAKVYHNVNVASVGGWPNDYRIPDIVILLPECRAIRRDAYFEGPPSVVVEIQSPGDESKEKLPFYLALGVDEVWTIDRDSKVVTIYTRSEGEFDAKTSDAECWVLSQATGLELRNSLSGGGAPVLSIRKVGDASTREDLPPP